MGAAAYASSVGKNEGSPSRKSGNNRCGGTRTQPPSRSNASRQALCVFIKTLSEPASRTGLDGPSWQVDCCTSSIHDGSGARLRHPDSGRSQLVHQLRAGGLQPGPRLLPACVAGGAAHRVIAVFNLLPGYPLDGGRLVRASLWAWRGSFDWATRVASTIGRVTGLMLAGFGAANAAASGELISGLWLVMVGIFVHQSARAAGRLGETRERRAPVEVEPIEGHVA